MRRMPAVLITCLLGVALLTGSFTGSATAQKGDKDDPKLKLPTYWKSLDLTLEQKEKAQKIMKEYGPKIKKLKKELEKAEADEKQDLFKVLTDAQKEKLRKIYLDKLGIDPFLPPSDKVDPKKDPEAKKDSDPKKDPEKK